MRRRGQLITLLLLILCSAGRAHAAIALVDHCTGHYDGAQDETCTLTNSATADLIVVVFTRFTATDAFTLMYDTQGGFGSPGSPANTYTELTASSDPSGTFDIAWGWSKPTHVGATHVFILPGTYNYGNIFVAAFSGTHASPFDQEDNPPAIVGVTKALTLAPGALTATVANSLYVTAVSLSNDGGNDTPHTLDRGAGFTITDTFDANDGNPIGGMAYKVGSANENPAWTWLDTSYGASSMAIFKPAAAGGSVTPKATLLGVGP